MFVRSGTPDAGQSGANSRSTSFETRPGASCSLRCHFVLFTPMRGVSCWRIAGATVVRDSSRAGN